MMRSGREGLTTTPVSDVSQPDCSYTPHSRQQVTCQQERSASIMWNSIITSDAWISTSYNRKLSPQKLCQPTWSTHTTFNLHHKWNLIYPTSTTSYIWHISTCLSTGPLLTPNSLVFQWPCKQPCAHYKCKQTCKPATRPTGQAQRGPAPERTQIGYRLAGQAITNGAAPINNRSREVIKIIKFPKVDQLTY